MPRHAENATAAGTNPYRRWTTVVAIQKAFTRPILA